VTDEIDLAQDRERIATEDAIRKVQKKAVLAPGVPGDCEECGEANQRIGGGGCSRCRDLEELKAKRSGTFLKRKE